MDHPSSEYTTAMRLAVYGTLAPGRVNHGQLASLKGVWSEGKVRGILKQEGWGSDMGFPGIIIQPQSPYVDVQVFTSKDLPEHWGRLDAFEGPDYRRVVTDVLTQKGVVAAQIYEVKSPG